MKTKLPLLITGLAGLLIIISEFIPVKPFSTMSADVEKWFLIISGFALVLGQLSLLKMNTNKIISKNKNWQFSLITIISFLVMFTFGILFGTKQNAGILGNGNAIINFLGEKPFDYIFSNIQQHLIATTFSLLAFYIASAAYRAFIARTFDSSLLLISAIIVMLGNTSIGYALTSNFKEYLQLPKIADFIMSYPNLAGQRAILIGAGIGIIGSSLRIILGLERSWLGGKK
jgi:hypothetical protein